MQYNEFIQKKAYQAVRAGFTPAAINEKAKPHQRAIVEWACKRGKAAIFADTGLGKTLMQCEWARLISDYTGKPVLILAPLAVGKQTQGECEKFGIDGACYVRDDNNDYALKITNYEMLKMFNPDSFGGIVLDESSILKGESSKYRKLLTDFAKRIDYRLSCTATPSPNDFMELGTQAEFLGVMQQQEMLAMFFTHDGSNTQKWRLKGHGASKFWEWLATWAVVISSPADLGFDGAEYELPPLTIETEMLPASQHDGLFAKQAEGLSEVQRVKRETQDSRVKACAKWVNSLNEPCLVWAESNAESTQLTQLIDNAVEVAGSHKSEVKEDRLLGFSSGKYERLVSKVKIAGFGMNWQHACKMAFVAPTYSFEGFYQAVRRQWRFGQTKPVLVKVFLTEDLQGVHDTMLRKLEQDKQMREEMIKVMSGAMKAEITGAYANKTDYQPTVAASLPKFI